MRTPVFEGSGVALVTPFTENGTDYDKLAELIEYQIENKSDALVICGTTGEASTMHDGEHMEAIRFSVERAAGRLPIIAGTGSNYTEHCIELSQYAERVGADALLIVTPYYNKTSQRGLIAHYGAVAASVKLPCILYNVPARTGLNIAPQTLFELSAIPNIVAIKEASGNVAQCARMLALCGDKIDMYSGNDEITLPLMSLGAKGVISVVANIAPQKMHDMAAKYLSGDLLGSQRLQLEMMELIDAMFIDVNPIPVKTALNLLGFNVGPVRMPLYEMDDERLKKLKAALINSGYKLAQ